MKKHYDRPIVETVNASDLVEKLGPAQGYAITGNPEQLTSALTGMDSSMGTKFSE